MNLKKDIHISKNINTLKCKKHETDLPARKIIGIVLLLFSGVLFMSFTFIFTGHADGLIFAVPFILCGLICMFAERPVIWCLWATAISAGLFMNYVLGASPYFLMIVLKGHVDPIKTLLSVIMLICAIALIVITILRFYKSENKHPLMSLLICLIAESAIVMSNYLIANLLINASDDMKYLIGIIANIKEYVQYALTAAVLVFAAQTIYRKLLKKKSF